VKNKRIDLPYYKWFDVANISRNPNNKEEDFSKYKSDKEMSEVISRIRKDKLPPDEFKYVSDLYMYDIHMARMAEDFKEKLARKEAAQKKRLAKMAEQQKKILEQQRKEAEQQQKIFEQQRKEAEQQQKMAEQQQKMAEQEVVQERQKAEMSQTRLLKSIKILLQQGETIASISEALDISVGETTELVALVQNS
jgi:septal ring factor EnvC (AmiA/AmiB activator)